jgi:hypothetical protein
MEETVPWSEEAMFVIHHGDLSELFETERSGLFRLNECKPLQCCASHSELLNGYSSQDSFVCLIKGLGKLL